MSSSCEVLNSECAQQDKKIPVKILEAPEVNS